ncbi:MAG: RluA family pseudouridine synthase [Maricaulaceae bacterium]|jgi:23S rRNA pseudouridine955/2504/2580 synthase
MSGVETVEVKAGEAGARLDRWFRRRYPQVTQGALQKLLRTGQVRVDGARAKADKRLEAGQSVRVPPLPEAAPPSAPKAVSAKDKAFVRGLVIYEDDDMIALNKPAGLAVQGGTKTTRHLDGMLDALAKKGERPRLVHRLDRDTSGVLILGRTPAAAAALAKAFQSHRAQKTYWAIVRGVPRPARGWVKGFIKKGRPAGGGDREMMVRAKHGEAGAQHARTAYAVVANAGKRASWLALRPETGRTHQLRFHAAEIGHSICGDRKYACDIPEPEGLPEGLMLHARELVIPHPSQNRALALTAPLCAHMADAFEQLGFDESAYDDPFADE